MNVYPEHPPKLSGYLIGFVLALLLTLTAFGLVIAGTEPLLAEGISRGTVVIAVSLLAVLQILVHLHYFLHLSFGIGNLKIVALLFTLFIIAVMVGGTLWIMYDLNYRMLPSR
ncbi:MAG: cytochrome o ubiquinol oxidase subunit IV [Gammaproteobacteria bacterium]